MEQWGPRAKENVHNHFYEENVGIVGRNLCVRAHRNHQGHVLSKLDEVENFRVYELLSRLYLGCTGFHPEVEVHVYPITEDEYLDNALKLSRGIRARPRQ